MEALPYLSHVWQQCTHSMHMQFPSTQNANCVSLHTPVSYKKMYTCECEKHVNNYTN